MFNTEKAKFHFSFHILEKIEIFESSDVCSLRIVHWASGPIVMDWKR